MTNDRSKRAARAEQMRKEREKADKRQRNVITVAIVVIVIALVSAAGWAIQKASSERKVETKVVVPKAATKDYGVVYTAKDAGAQEDASDPVTVVIYEDFQCPVCKQFEAAYGATLEALVKSGDIEIEYRFLNFLDNGGSLNGYSGRAASAALCVLEDEGGPAFKKVHDALYATQPEERTAGPVAAEILDTIKGVGVDVDADLKSCVTKERFRPWVEKGTDDSRKKKVSGTPSVMIDGKFVEGKNGGVPSMEDIAKAIDAAKKK